MKILFLDFDGVLTYCEPRTAVWNEACVARLHEVLEATGTNIVISSSWRHAYSVEDLAELLGLDHGDPTTDETGVVVGATPGIGRIFTHDDGGRGTKIAEWLAENGRWVDTWAIVDDDDFDMHPWQLSRMVRTTTGVGLQDEHVKELIFLLGEQ